MSAAIGRFAPSPTGSLHIGSLMTALASYLDARSRQGLWLVRMEDLDPPREMPGAAENILRTLESFHLTWDGEVLYQKPRSPVYESFVQTLLRQKLAYPCFCSRKQLEAYGPVYPGFCRHANASQANDQEHAIRVLTPDETLGDFIIKRKDKLYAYHLAVVVDDHLQGVTHIVRGQDLLSSTPYHIYLQTLLKFETPDYLHIPIIVDANGRKLSKQERAQSIEGLDKRTLILALLKVLGQNPPSELKEALLTEILQWAVAAWNSATIPEVASVPVGAVLTKQP